MTESITWLHEFRIHQTARCGKKPVKPNSLVKESYSVRMNGISCWVNTRYGFFGGFR